MSLYLHSEAHDASTDAVLDWLYYLYPGLDLTRLNGAAGISTCRYELSDTGSSLQLRAGGKCIDTDQLRRYWYRRGHLSWQQWLLDSGYTALGSTALRYMERELHTLGISIQQSLQENLKGINKESDNQGSKLQHLALARKAGLQIPHTLVCSEWADLLDFAARYERIITKAMAYPSFDACLADTRFRLSCSTQLLHHKDILALRERSACSSFLPSLFQAYIDKQFELRIFYLAGNCYPMAIFSQANERTRIDFRHYDYKRPNRYVPYSLPEAISTAIGSFMCSADLNCGSIDMIFTADGRYVFLEVNPVGQYQWLSQHCNYFIDRLLARQLYGNK